MSDIREIIWILVVYTAIILLIRFYVYPYLKILIRSKISVSVQIHRKGKKTNENKSEDKETGEKQEITPSFLGKSKFVLSQPVPHAATNSETENRKGKEDTFAPESGKPADENINYETGEGLEITEDDQTEKRDNPAIDLYEEDDEPGTVSDTGTELASGIDYYELGATTQAIEHPGTGSKEEKIAGKILSENKCTQLVESIRDVRPEYARRISALIDMYECELAETQNREIEISRKQQELYDSEDFKNFDVNAIS